MNITVESKIADYYILSMAVTDAMTGADPWGINWFPDIDKWCLDSFGEQDIWGSEPVNGWKRMRDRYFFTSQDMCSMFVLRWS